MDTTEPKIKQLYDDYADPIYRFLYWHTSDPLLAEDLVSEVFVRAWKHRDKLGDNGTGDNPRAWLYRVARNLVIDHYRRKKDEVIDETIEVASSYDLHAEAEWADTRTNLHKALASLSFEDRNIIVLRFFEYYSAKEVAAIIGKTEGNVRVLQHRALKELKKRLTI